MKIYMLNLDFKTVYIFINFVGKNVTFSHILFGFRVVCNVRVEDHSTKREKLVDKKSRNTRKITDEEVTGTSLT